jgi:hypothetical protein
LTSALADHVAALVLAVAADLPDRDLAPAAWYAAHHDTPLALCSLEVVQLVDLIESSLDVLMTSDDVTRDNFATASALVARLRRRGLA